MSLMDLNASIRAWATNAFAPPLLDNHYWVLEYPAELARIRRKRQRCRLVGHMWSMNSISFVDGYSVLECFRCYPHRDSRRRVKAPSNISDLLRRT